MNRDDFIAALDLPFNSLSDRLALLSPQQVEQPLAEGKWSLKDLIAHFIFWDTITVRALEACYHNLPFNWNKYADWNSLNARAAEEMRDSPVKRVAAEWQVTHAIMLETLNRVPDERLLENGEIPKWLHENVLDHYTYHASQVDEFLKRREI